jgi:hypothetical protein
MTKLPGWRLQARGVTRTSMAARVTCSARLCENPVFGAHELCNLLILLDRIFEKSTFDTVWRPVRPLYSRWLQCHLPDVLGPGGRRSTRARCCHAFSSGRSTVTCRLSSVVMRVRPRRRTLTITSCQEECDEGALLLTVRVDGVVRSQPQ